MPGDLSLVGYDAVGLRAGGFILERRENRDLPQRLHLVPTQLLVRGSTGHPPDSA
ncbi:hypothetical protein SAMN04487914_11469 [Arthrobacter sp. ok909]|uniref:hypothetical protein n=1 Tax=Arthrobacter sp. ok909 TaxID=1761746 RepID=UPI000891B6A3|nr:hypothetical protein SAMN04487914_11469 [Arthrobacter sp. ok909]